MVAGRVDEDTNYIISTIKAIFDLTLSQALRVILCVLFSGLLGGLWLGWKMKSKLSIVKSILKFFSSYI